VSTKKVKTADPDETAEGVIADTQEVEIQKESSVVIYIGPTISGIAMTGTVFSNGVPKKLEETCKNYPFFNGLIVPVEKTALAQENLRKENTPINLFYKKAVEFSQKRGE